jgi:phospholipid transport system substrate-binding protein
MDFLQTRRSAGQLLMALAGALCLIGTWTASSAATVEQAGITDEPTRLVKETTEKLFAAIVDRGLTPGHADGMAALIEEIVSPHVDYDRISRWVLGPHWRDASPEQQARFTEEFHKLLTRMYANVILEHTNSSIEYVRQTSGTGDPNEASVLTELKSGGEPPLGITYRLHHDDSSWKLFDISVEGTSLVSTHRAAFSAEIDKSGIDGLIDALAAKNAAGATQG